MENYLEEISLGSINDYCSLTSFCERKYKWTENMIIKFSRLSLKKGMINPEKKKKKILRNIFTILFNFEKFQYFSFSNYDKMFLFKC